MTSIGEKSIGQLNQADQAAPGDPGREPEIQAAMSDLIDQQARLGSKLCHLRERLEVVLSPNEGSAEGAAVDTPSAPLAKLISQQARGLEGMADMVGDLLSRLEV